jgi:Fe-S-cluster containining protein
LEYKQRPRVCSDYPESDENCTYESKDPYYKEIFKNHKELEAYLDRRRIDWRFKKNK